jgi:CheY-like chemotaxis protein
MKTRVLVVDGDRLVADTLNLIFRANGFECEAVYTAAEALERSRTFQPQLLLCDVSMPAENGLQLAEKLSLEQPGCRLLLLTAYAGNVARVESHAEALRRPLKLLRKPCRPEELLSEAHALLATA